MDKLGVLNYGSLATDTTILEEFICTSNYNEVLQHVKEHKKVALCGPKGVGKTTCLLSL